MHNVKLFTNDAERSSLKRINICYNEMELPTLALGLNFIFFMLYSFHMSVNTIPRVITNSSIEVEINKEVKIHVRGVDDDNDEVTLELISDVPGGVFDNVTGYFTWTPLNSTPVLLA